MTNGLHCLATASLLVMAFCRITTASDSPEVTPGYRAAPNDARGGGDASSGGADPLVYSNTGGTALLQMPFANLQFADDLETTAACGCNLARYEFQVESGGSPVPGFTVQFALYDGCPHDGGEVLPGTEGQMTFPDDGYHLVTHEVTQGPVPIPPTVWLAVSFDRVGPGCIIGAPADIGFTADLYDSPIDFCMGSFPDTSIYAGFVVDLYCDGTTGPLAATEPNPVHGRVGIAWNTQLSWEQRGLETCAALYDVYVGTTDPPSVLVCPASPTRSCDPGPLQPNRTYFWQVATTDDSGTTTGPVWWFTTYGDGPDCNDNSVPDDVDIGTGTSLDCNGNSIPDECDLIDGTSLDCNTNGVPDECEPDCNSTGIPDDCEVLDGTSPDCNANGLPDECDLLDPPVLFSGDFSEPFLDPVDWPVADHYHTHCQPDGCVLWLFTDGIVESREIDLRGTLRVVLTMDVRLSDVQDLIVEYWNGLEWLQLTSESDGADDTWDFRRFDLKEDAKRADFRLRVRAVEAATGRALRNMRISRIEEDCNANSLPDACDLFTPGEAFYEDFSEYVGDYLLDPADWPVAHDYYLQDYTDPNFVAFDRGGLIESREIDLTGAYEAWLSFDVAYSAGSNLRAEAWTGRRWVMLMDEWSDEYTEFERRTFALPTSALDTETRLRFSVPPDAWGPDLREIRITRVEGDCDDSGSLDTCDTASGAAADCNANGRPDSCDFERLHLKDNQTHEVPRPANAVAVADYDQDGNLDIAVGLGGGGFSSSGLGVLFGDGQGGFVYGHEYYTEWSTLGWPRHVKSGDLNGDGWPDLVTSSQHGDGVAVLMNLGGMWWGFDDTVRFDMGDEGQSMALADLDNDGDIDIAVALGVFPSGNGTAAVLVNDGHAGFTVGPSFAVGGTPRAIVAVDVNNDGLLDLATADQWGNGVSLGLNNGFGADDVWLGFAPAINLPTESSGGGPFSVAASDFNRDGWQDLVAGNADSQDPARRLAIILNLGADASGEWLGFADTYTRPSGIGPAAVEAGDLTGDGWPDLVLAGGDTDGGIEIRMNLGDGGTGGWLGFGQPIERFTGSFPFEVDFADVDVDGALDIIVANRAMNFSGQSAGTASVSVIYQYTPYTTDCNDNDIPDDCDIESGTSADVDDNGTPDECEADCDGNGVPDGYELSEALATDCNDNGLPDVCDSAAGNSADCDGNGVLDECEVPRAFTASSDRLGPLTESHFQSLTVPSPPPADGHVTIEVTAVAGLNSSDFVDVDLNGTPIGRLDDSDVFNCSLEPGIESIVLTAEEFNTVVAGGDAVIGLTTSFYPSYPCRRYPYPYEYSMPHAWLAIHYDAVGVPDCNNNHVPDVCDIASLTSEDCNGNAEPDECEVFGEPASQPFAVGLTVPEDVVPSGGDYPPGYLVPDVSSGVVWHVSPDGNLVQSLTDEISRPIGAVMVPDEFTGTGERLIAASQGSATVHMITPDGVTSVFAEPSASHAAGITYVPASVGGAAAGSVLMVVHNSTYDAGTVVALQPDGTSSQLIPFVPSRLFAVAIAPAGFGDFGRQMFLAESSGPALHAVDLQTLERRTFALVPLVGEQPGLRQMAFSPVGWGTWLNRSLAGESLLVLSVSGSTTGGTMPGALHILDQRGRLLTTISEGPNGQPINPRGITFVGDDMLVSDTFTGRILRFTVESLDCNANEIIDTCDIDLDPSLDINASGIIDSCDLPGDYNGDGLVDLDDWLSWDACVTGPAGGPYQPPCMFFDADGDADVDLDDFATVQAGFTGP